MTDFYEEFYRPNEMKQWWYVSNSFCTVVWMSDGEVIFSQAA